MLYFIIRDICEIELKAYISYVANTIKLNKEKIRKKISK